MTTYKEKPYAVTGLSIGYTDSSGQFSASWKLGAHSSGTYTKSVKIKKKKKTKTVKRTMNAAYKSQTVRWRLFYDSGSYSKTYTVGKSATSKNMFISGGVERKNTYPDGGKPVRRITVTVTAINDKGSTATSTTLNLSTPAKPEVETLEYDNEGNLKSTIKPADRSKGKDRYRTEWKLVASVNGGSEVATGLSGSPTADTEIKPEYDASQYAAVPTGGVDDYATLLLYARSRGLGGDSAWVIQKHVFAYPPKPSISGEIVVKDGIPWIPCKTDATDTHPVDTLQLQRLVATAYSETTGWSDISSDDGGVDANSGGNAENLHDSSMPTTTVTEGYRVWYRLVATHDNLSRTSTAVEVPSLAASTTATTDSGVTIAAADSADGGAIITCEWDASDDTRDTTTIGWSDDKQADIAITSSAMTSTTVSDTNKAIVDSGKLKAKITGLEAGKMWYFWAKRSNASDDSYTDKSWAGPASCSVTESGGWGVSLAAPATAVVGSTADTTASVQLSWAVTGGTQDDWQISGVSSTGEQVYAASGHGSTTVAEVPGSTVFSTGGGGAESITFTIYAKCEKCAETLTSTATMRLVWLPEVSPAISYSAIESLPFGFVLDVWQKDALCAGASVDVRLESLGSTSETPGGRDMQAMGDVLWSASGLISDSSGQVTGSVTAADIGAGVLFDGCTYRLMAAATASDGTIGEDMAIADLKVTWARQAAECVECDIDIDEDNLSATITPTAPADTGIVTGDGSTLVDDMGATISFADSSYSAADANADANARGDVYDIWRVDAAGATLYGEGIEFGKSITDPWAPFGTRPGEDGLLVYRVATRTADGDVAWQDFEYELPCGDCVIDFGGERLTLSYNLQYSLSAGKSFDARQYLGEDEAAGYWERAVDRSMSISADIPRTDYETERLLEKLNEYRGACFVRTPAGYAFECNAEASISRSSSSGSVDVSIKCTEIALTDYAYKGKDDA